MYFKPLPLSPFTYSILKPPSKGASKCLPANEAGCSAALTPSPFLRGDFESFALTFWSNCNHKYASASGELFV